MISLGSIGLAAGAASYVLDCMEGAETVEDREAAVFEAVDKLQRRGVVDEMTAECLFRVFAETLAPNAGA